MPVYEKTYEPRFDPSRDPRFTRAPAVTQNRTSVTPPGAPMGYTESRDVYKIGDKEITREEYEKFNKASDKGKFDFLVEKGVIPQGSQFVEGLSQQRIDEIKKLSQEGIGLGIVPDSHIQGIEDAHGWGYYTPEQVKEMEAFKIQRATDVADYIEAVKLARKEALIAAGEAIDIRLVDVKTTPKSQLDVTKKLKVIPTTPKAETKGIPNYEQWVNDYLEAHGTTHKAVVGAYTAEILGKGTEETKRLKQINADANRAYAEKYGAGAIVGAAAAEGLAPIFPAARALAPDVTFKDISGMEWAITGAQIALLAAPIAGQGVGAVAGSAAAKVTTAAILGGAGVVMSYDTAKNWARMSPVERGISVAMDTIVVVSAVLPLASVIRSGGKVDVIKSSEAALKYNQKAYSAVDTTLGKNYSVLARDQIAYAKNIKAQYQLERTIASASNKVEKIRFERQLQALKTREMILNKRLVDSGRAFVNRFESVYAANIKGEPTIAEGITRLPNELPRQTKTIVLNSLTANKAEITALKAQVVKLETELKTLRNKYPTSPDKWGDVSADLQYTKSKLNVALAGNVEAMQMQLQATRDNIIYLRGIVNSQADDVIREEARALLKQAIADEKTLTANLKQAYNAMDAEWTRQQPSGGGVKTVTRPPTRTPTPLTGFGSGTAVQSSTNTMTAAQLAALRGYQPEDAISSRQVLAPSTKVKSVVFPASVPGTRILPGQKPAEITRPVTGTQQNTRTQVNISTGMTTATTAGSETTPSNETELNTPTQPTPKLSPPPTRTPVKSPPPTKQEPPRKPPVRPPFPDIKKGKQGETLTVPKGSVTWKQGVGWWTRKPPYGQKDSVFTLRKPLGAVTVKNADSAYDTIQTISGLPPEKIPDFDMGIVTVKTRRPPAAPRRGNRSAISFQQNPKVVKRRRVPNKRVGPYFVSGNMVSRHKIG